MELLVIFESSHDAMKTFKHVSEQGIDCEIIPTPREVSSECGFALLTRDSNNKILSQELDSINIENYNIYNKSGDIYEKD